MAKHTRMANAKVDPITIAAISPEERVVDEETWVWGLMAVVERMAEDDMSVQGNLHSTKKYE